MKLERLIFHKQVVTLFTILGLVTGSFGTTWAHNHPNVSGPRNLAPTDGSCLPLRLREFWWSKKEQISVSPSENVCDQIRISASFMAALRDI